MSTKLVYLENMHDLEADAFVERVEKQDGRDVVYLDQTILYPQGGGQPYDQGLIQGGATKFIVEEVRFVDGDVLHFGHFEGYPFMPGEDVHIVVDGDRRKLNARLHSGGHLVDMAVTKLGLDWVPGKGYHFPDGPYVEYDGELDPEQQAELQARIEVKANELIEQNLPVSCHFVEYEELKHLCRHVPTNLPTNKPIRVVQFDNFAVPCGGTHVHSLADIQKLTITKLKKKGGSIRVGYAVEV
jgi:Ser-tRNA(Ala) deacylase AlaX